MKQENLFPDDDADAAYWQRREEFGPLGEPEEEPEPELDDICRNKHGGNQESEEANTAIDSNKAAVRLKIYEYALARGERGITADEVAAEWGTTHNHVAPRISELKRAHFLIPIKKRRPTRAGCSARVLVAKGVHVIPDDNRGDEDGGILVSE